MTEVPQGGISVIEEPIRWFIFELSSGLIRN